MGAVRVLLADDHPVFREGLQKLLESERGFTVVGAAADGIEAVELARKLSPDVLLLDLAMPRMPGLEVLRELSSPPNGGAHDPDRRNHGSFRARACPRPSPSTTASGTRLRT